MVNYATECPHLTAAVVAMISWCDSWECFTPFTAEHNSQPLANGFIYAVNFPYNSTLHVTSRK